MCESHDTSQQKQTGCETEWVSDTGTSVDVTGGVPGVRVKQTGLSMLHTAGGTVAPSETVLATVEELAEEIEAAVLEGSPHALTVGRRCAQLGYEFHWRPYHASPSFTKPNGQELDVYTESLCR